MSADPALSRAIAFLQEAPSGVSIEVLQRAERLARAQGVVPARILIAAADLTEIAYYRALAQHVGLTFVEDPGALLMPDRPPNWRDGLARLPDGRGGATWLTAPALDRVPRYLAEGLFPKLAGRALAMTAPAIFERAWIATGGAALAAHAVQDLSSRGLSFAAPEQPARRLRILGPILVVLALLAGLVGGSLVSSAASAVMSHALGALFGGLFVAASAVRIVAAGSAVATAEPAPLPLSDAELPVYTVLVPLYREAHMLRGLIARLDALDYPRSKLDVCLLVETEDAVTRGALAVMNLPPWCRVLVMPEGQPRTKPRAMQIALPFARGKLLTIYDAEDEPEPGQLRAAAGVFARSDPRLACLQAHLVVDNVSDSMVSRLFAIEYAALFDVVNPGLAVRRWPVPLGGTSNHFWVDALHRAGGWDAWNVAEDADLGMRLARCGYRVGTFDSGTHEEAPATLRTWMNQRRRWQKGWLQTIVTQICQPAGTLRAVGALRTGVAATTLLGGVLGPLFGPFFVFALARDAAFGDLLRPAGGWSGVASGFVVLVAVCGLVAVGVPTLLGLRRRRLWRHAWVLPLLPVYYLMMSWAAWLALFDLARAPFHWAKTEHGLARTSQRHGTGMEADAAPQRR